MNSEIHLIIQSALLCPHTQHLHCDGALRLCYQSHYPVSLRP